ncbi:MAG: hypothetical protein IJU50_09305 [Lachnospiraceae bacterium]|nr:hypothetical protein [Lachnospiraceae bacterium]
MLLSERLLLANRRVNQEQAKQTEVQQDQDEDEQGYSYEDRPPAVFLNRDKGVFKNNEDDNALNTAASVFNRTAIFRTDLPSVD